MADNGLRASAHTSYPALDPSNHARRHLGAEWPLFAETPERQHFEAHLRSLETAVHALSRRLSLHRIATVIAQAVTDALDAQAMIIAVHEEDGRHLRGVYVAGLPEEAQHRLATIPTTAPTLVGEIDRSVRGSGETGLATARSPHCRSRKASARSASWSSAGRTTGRSLTTTARSSTRWPASARSLSIGCRCAPTARACARCCAAGNSPQDRQHAATGGRHGDRPRGAADHDR